jgi:hypothetical protein
MSRLKIRPEYEAAIKDETETIFGRSIGSYRDCIDLSEDIFRKTQKQLNANTLRRIFGLVKADYPPSLATLTILSTYCGFYSVEELYNVKQKNNGSIVEQEQLLNYVVSLFIETPIKDLHDKTFLSLIKHTICFLNFNVTLADKFLSLIVKTKNGQDFYFEHFVNIDKLNSYYGDGIRYYLHEKATEEASVFAHSLVLFKYWLNGNIEGVLRQSVYLSPKSHVALAASPAVYSRYFAGLLFHANVTGQNAEEILINIYKYYSSSSFTSYKQELVSFEYVISEALVLTGHSNDALHYLANYRKNFIQSEHSNYLINLNNLKLLEALAQYQAGKTHEAEQIFDEIKPSDFHFLNKKFAGILYIQLMNKLKRKNLKSSETKEKLVKETGFVRLGSLLPE